ncbi:hypothetical protein AB0E83_28940 [Streptomyces sp. NPDC035033]|uniref:hypothetical protein n=1 Tax=Streptomyces sp. NPDC035033 TaxID=3155368 RepID=UPI0033F8B632
MGDTREPVRDTPGKPYRRWVWILALVGTVCAVPLAFLAWGAYSLGQAGREQTVDCGKAMEFARARLPESAVDARCTGTHWQDTLVEVDFRMPAAEAGTWLESAYPKGEPPYSCGKDLCRKASFDEQLYVDVEVAYEDGGTALVHLRAFDV